MQIEKQQIFAIMFIHFFAIMFGYVMANLIVGCVVW
jgi:hypothetical protein